MNTLNNVKAPSLRQLESGVWAPTASLPKFGYSDGVATEAYLKKIFSEADDLSCKSEELQTHIKDWPSEYHLSLKRSQLLSGFDHRSEASVLEVGCGCGSITRFLGETYSSVTSVEGSLTRAELARERCRDLSNVQIICSPFQSLEFSAKFDVVFCIGVLEYSASFVDSVDPYKEVLRVFSDVLSPSGVAFIAIENQFGLKYLNGCREDHVGRKFEGIQGYPSSGNVVRTFGKTELDEMLRDYFPRTSFFFPYPDYKVPDCVLTEEFLGTPDCGELIGQNQSRDYVGQRQSLWDESLTVHELAKNKVMPFFSDSFIAVASKSDDLSVRFPQLGVIFSSDRRQAFNTRTRIEGLPGKAIVKKRRQNPDHSDSYGKLRFENVDCDWQTGFSLFTEIYRRSKSGTEQLDEIFDLCKPWLRHLQAEAQETDGRIRVSGSMIDATWKNTFICEDECRFIDTEWHWGESIDLSVLVIRSIYIFLVHSYGSSGIAADLRGRRSRKIIMQVASSFGVDLSMRDFQRFVTFEADFQYCVRGADPMRTARYLRLYLVDRATLTWATRNLKRTKVIASRLLARVRRGFSGK